MKETQRRVIDRWGPPCAHSAVSPSVPQNRRRFHEVAAALATLSCAGLRRSGGQSEPQMHISKEGDPYLRTLLVQAAPHILGPFGIDCDPRRWGLNRDTMVRLAQPIYGLLVKRQESGRNVVASDLLAEGAPIHARQQKEKPPRHRAAVLQRTRESQVPVQTVLPFNGAGLHLRMSRMCRLDMLSRRHR